jgi:hypothetical protein
MVAMEREIATVSVLIDIFLDDHIKQHGEGKKSACPMTTISQIEIN